MTGGAAQVDAYLAALNPDQHACLQALRATLRRWLPDHDEVMSYAMPGFRQPGRGGRMVVGYAAFKVHLGLYPHSGNVIGQIDCTPFKTSKSGVLFTPSTPLPEPLIHQILTLRQNEIAQNHGLR